MSIVLTAPPEIALISHSRGVIFAQQNNQVDHTTRREIVRRFERERSQYPTVKAFAERESARLRRDGVTYSAKAIETFLCRRKGRLPKLCVWERLLARFRKKNPRSGEWWYDHGDLAPVILPDASAGLIVAELSRLRRRGYEIHRRPASWQTKAERGWLYEYRLWEAGA